jgi:hypothetical protein
MPRNREEAMPMSSAALLKLLAALQGAGDDEYEAEVVREGRQCWRGAERVPNRVIDKAIRCSAVDSVGEAEALERRIQCLGFSYSVGDGRKDG